MTKVFKLEHFDLDVLDKALAILEYEDALAKEFSQKNLPPSEWVRPHGVDLVGYDHVKGEIDIQDGDIMVMRELVQELRKMIKNGGHLDCMAAA